jgi:hypothetical protein
MRLSLRLEGAPGLAAMALHQVAWTVASGGVAAAALPAARRAASGWEITVPAGTTRQVWCSVDARRMTSGCHTGTIVIAGSRTPRLTVPLRVRVSPVVMPERLSLALGGWDYTDGPELYNTSEAVRLALIRFLQEYQVDAPWATKQVMRFGTHGPDGTMTSPPDTAAMDDWLRRWPRARWYCVFNNFEGVDAANPRELPVGSPAWEKAVGEWITFWVGHLQHKGVPPSRLRLLLVDEPRNPETDQLTLAYARVIRAAQPSVVLWTDPVWDDPRNADPALYETVNIIAPQRPRWLASPGLYEEVFLRQQRAGRRLAFYSCSGPVRALDPYSYHRLQAWDCFRYGMSEEFFWSFGGGGGMAPWIQLAGEQIVFTPQFITPAGCTTAKHMEAIREGRYDFEYLVMLREAIAAAEGAGNATDVVNRARRLLAEAPGRVLSAPGADSVWWAQAKNRDLADTVRLQVLDLIERLTLARGVTRQPQSREQGS